MIPLIYLLACGLTLLLNRKDRLPEINLLAAFFGAVGLITLPTLLNYAN